MTVWTFETLARADRKSLEDVLLAAHAPDLAQLAGRVYDGYNHERLPRLLGAEKFTPHSISTWPASTTI